jgi:hypothetical protein
MVVGEEMNTEYDPYEINTRSEQFNYLRKRLLIVKMRNKILGISVFFVISVGYALLLEPIWKSISPYSETGAVLVSCIASLIYLLLIIKSKMLNNFINKFFDEEAKLSGEKDYLESCLKMARIFDRIHRNNQHE